jgi:hypothetical protein
MIAYALDISVLMAASFWHVFFLINSGLFTAYFLWSKINNWNAALTTPATDVIAVNPAWKLLFFGITCGVTNYIAGMALNVNKETLSKLVGFTPVLDNETSAYMNTDIGAGTKTVAITISQDEESKKDWFDLYEVAENWNLLFVSQRMLQFVLPFVYIGIVELSVSMVFMMSFWFFNPTASD